jgi:hypothetical protein
MYWLGTTKTGQHPNSDSPENALFSIFFVQWLSVTFLSTINACLFYNLVNEFISTSVNGNILMSISMLTLKFGRQESNA